MAQTGGLCAMSCSKASICAKLCSVDRVSKIPESRMGAVPKAAASSAGGACSSTTTLAPSDRTKSTSDLEAVDITRTPDAVANCMARVPISEAPLMMRIVCSSSSSPSSRVSRCACGRGKFRLFLW